MSEMMETIAPVAAEVRPVVVVPAAVLRELAAVTIAASKGEGLPTLEGVRIEWEPGTIRMVTTDRFRLAVTEWHGDSTRDAVEGAALIPATELAAYVKGLPKPGRGGTDFPVTLALDVIENTHSKGHALTFTCTTYDGQLVRRVVGIDGDFPKWNTLIPREDQLAESQGVTGISCNPQYLADVSKMPQERKGNPVAVRFTTPTRPMLWTGEGAHVSWQYLLMPVKVPS